MVNNRNQNKSDCERWADVKLFFPSWRQGKEEESTESKIHFQKSHLSFLYIWKNGQPCHSCLLCSNLVHATSLYIFQCIFPVPLRVFASPCLTLCTLSGQPLLYQQFPIHSPCLNFKPKFFHRASQVDFLTGKALHLSIYPLTQLSEFEQGLSQHFAKKKAKRS